MMRRVLRRAGGALCGVLLAVGCAYGQSWPSEGPPPPLQARPVDFPSYQLRTLPNGLQVLVIPHHEQPSVSFRMIVRAGAVQEPANRPGVASFVAALLNQGTATRSASEIADTIDSAGGLLGVGSGNELTFVQGAVVKDQTDLALALMSDIVRNPAFPEQEITLQKQQALNSLQVGYDDPEYLANAAFNRVVFGAHPYGRPGQGTPDTIGRITRADLAEFHRTWFVPNNALMAVVGDLTADQLFAAVERAFGDWERREVPAATAPAPPAPARRVIVIDRPGSAQTEIRAGHLSIERTHPDYITFDLAIRILGGEGANRLFGVLRSDRGLTYGASADLNTFRTAGVVVAETDTRTSATGESLRLMVDEFARLQRESVHPAELRGAQDFMAGNFPLTIETSSAIAEQVLVRLFYGQDLAEIETYLDRVGKVTPADIQRVSRQLLKPDALTIVMVGDAATFVNQLRSMGFTEYERIPVSQLDLDSPTLRR
ncbi:MAG: insulinase family protein [Acidobacteria bacterium]|nr:insulinase family protein [Acidobacteriota bacterium]